MSRRILSVVTAVLVACVPLLAGPSADRQASRPVLSFGPSVHDFGAVTLGHHLDKVLTLKNRGRVPATRLTLSIRGSGSFTVLGDTCRSRLSSKQSCTVTVRFEPGQGWPMSATVVARAGKHGRSHTVLARAALAGCGAELEAEPPVGQLYWPSEGGTINRTNVANPSVETVLNGQSGPVGIAATISHVYWTTPSSIMRADLVGSNATALVTGQAGPFGLALDANHLYWSSSGDGTIWRSRP